MYLLLPGSCVDQDGLKACETTPFTPFILFYFILVRVYHQISTPLETTAEACSSKLEALQLTRSPENRFY